MLFASTSVLRGLDFEPELVLPGVLRIARFPCGPQSLGADEKPFATSERQRQVVPARYRIRRSFPGPKHSPPDVRDRARESALHARARFARWRNHLLLGKQLQE